MGGIYAVLPAGCAKSAADKNADQLENASDNPRGFGWRSWGPFWGSDIGVHTVDRYEAAAEIILGNGAKPADDPRAFCARQVIDSLGPRIIPPR